MKRSAAVRKACASRQPARASGYRLPLRNSTFFLDLKSYKGAALLEKQFKLLGGTIEKCFSREVNILVTSRGCPEDYDHQAKSKNGDEAGTSAAATGSPATPSPFNLGNLRGNINSPQPDSPNTQPSKPMTRGQAIAQKANRTRNYGSTDVVDCAKKWKIKIVHIEQANKYIERELKKLPPELQHRTSVQEKKKKTQKCKQLSGSYLKYEAVNHHYRPVYQDLEMFPDIHWDSTCGRCPFEGPKQTAQSGPPECALERAEHEERDRPEVEDPAHGLQELEEVTEEYKAEGTKKQAVSSKTKASTANDKTSKKSSKKLGESSEKRPLYTAGELRTLLREKIRLEQKQGYCELCEVKYQDIDKHVRSDQHRAFVRDDTNYVSLDSMIAEGPNMEQFLDDVLHYHQLHQAASDLCSDDEVCLLSSPPVTPRARSRPTTSKAQALTPTGLPSKKSGSHKKHHKTPAGLKSGETRPVAQCLTDGSQVTDNTTLGSPRRSPRKRKLNAIITPVKNIKNDDQVLSKLPKVNQTISPRKESIGCEPFAQNSSPRSKVKCKPDSPRREIFRESPRKRLCMDVPMSPAKAFCSSPLKSILSPSKKRRKGIEVEVTPKEVQFEDININLRCENETRPPQQSIPQCAQSPALNSSPAPNVLSISQCSRDSRATEDIVGSTNGQLKRKARNSYSKKSSYSVTSTPAKSVMSELQQTDGESQTEIPATSGGTPASRSSAETIVLDGISRRLTRSQKKQIGYEQVSLSRLGHSQDTASDGSQRSLRRIRLEDRLEASVGKDSDLNKPAKKPKLISEPKEKANKQDSKKLIKDQILTNAAPRVEDDVSKGVPSQSTSTSHSRRVHLKHRWSLLSEHSMSRLLESEGDDQFNGFSAGDVNQGLASDMTYEEVSEVDLCGDSDHEWAMDEQDHGLISSKSSSIIPPSDETELDEGTEQSQLSHVPSLERFLVPPIYVARSVAQLEPGILSPVKLPDIKGLHAEPEDNVEKVSEGSDWDDHVGTYMDSYISEKSVLRRSPRKKCRQVNSTRNNASVVENASVAGSSILTMLPVKVPAHQQDILDDFFSGADTTNLWVLTPERKSTLKTYKSPRRSSASKRVTPNQRKVTAAVVTPRRSSKRQLNMSGDSGPLKCSTPMRTESGLMPDINKLLTEQIFSVSVDGDVMPDLANLEALGVVDADDEIQFNFSSPQKSRSRPCMSHLPSPIPVTGRNRSLASNNVPLPLQLPLPGLSEKISPTKIMRKSSLGCQTTEKKRIFKHKSTTKKTFHLSHIHNYQPKSVGHKLHRTPPLGKSAREEVRKRASLPPAWPFEEVSNSIVMSKDHKPPSEKRFTSVLSTKVTSHDSSKERSELSSPSPLEVSKDTQTLRCGRTYTKTGAKCDTVNTKPSSDLLQKDTARSRSRRSVEDTKRRESAGDSCHVVPKRSPGTRMQMLRRRASLRVDSDADDTIPLPSSPPEKDTDPSGEHEDRKHIVPKLTPTKKYRLHRFQTEMEQQRRSSDKNCSKQEWRTKRGLKKDHADTRRSTSRTRRLLAVDFSKSKDSSSATDPYAYR